MKNRHRRIRDYDPRHGDDVLEDGDTLHVPLMMCDSAQRAVQHHFDERSFVKDALAAHYRYSANKPGFVQDQLRQGAGQTINDASYDLHARRDCWFPEAVKMRDAAFAELEKRSQNAWKMDAKSAPPDDDPDADDDNDNDSDNAVEIDDLEAARKARDQAYQAAVERSANAWKLAPGRATQVEQQRQRWSAERPWNRSGL
jgi:hypothetical protein